MNDPIPMIPFPPNVPSQPLTNPGVAARSRSRSPLHSEPLDPVDQRAKLSMAIRQLVLPPLSPEPPRSRSPNRRGPDEPGQSGAASSGEPLLPLRDPKSPSVASTVQYPSPERPASAAGTIGYPSPPREADKRRVTWSPDVDRKKTKKGKEEEEEEEEEDKGKGQRASSSNEPLLPLKEDDEKDIEDDEVHLALWTEEIIENSRNEEHIVTSEANERLACEAQRAYFAAKPGQKAQEESEEIAIEGSLAKCHEWLGANLGPNDLIIFEVTPDGTQNPVIKKELCGLTKEELQKHAPAVAAGKFKEILGLSELACFERFPRKQSFNRVDVRWVITWKIMEKVRQIKCRLTMRGFKDRQTSLETYAGTTSRAGQRLVNCIVAQEEDWELFSIDVAQAFAKGLTFEQMARLTGTQLRAVEFELPPSDVALLRKIEGFQTFDALTEVLRMLKPIYGLKDAPRAWRKCLHLALEEFFCRQLVAEPEVYVRHVSAKQQKKQDYTIADRKQAEEVAGESLPKTTGTKEWVERTRTKLELITSTHVDDLKGGAKKQKAQELLDHLNKTFGQCKIERREFEHTGVEHKQTTNGIYTHQIKYISQLKQIDTKTISSLADEDLVDGNVHELYSSLLGGAAWTVLTRADGAVYVQALQRRGAAPRKCDIKRLNLLVRYIQKNPTGIWFGRVERPWKLIGWSDAAFRAQEEESSALAVRGLAVALATENEFMPASIDSAATLLDFLVRRLRRVVRSTFAAELNALIDAVESMIMVQLAMYQIENGTEDTAEELMHRLEAGQLTPPIEMCIDAKAVFDAVNASDVTTPQEASLKLHLISIRDRIEKGLIRALYWTDTRDMIADCLTKGGVDRSKIKAIMSGKVTLDHDYVRCPRPKRKYDPREADRNNPFAHPAPRESLVSQAQDKILQLLRNHRPSIDKKSLEELLVAYAGHEDKLMRALRLKYEKKGQADQGGRWCDEAEDQLQMRRRGMPLIEKGSKEARRQERDWTELPEEVDWSRKVELESPERSEWLAERKQKRQARLRKESQGKAEKLRVPAQAPRRTVKAAAAGGAAAAAKQVKEEPESSSSTGSCCSSKEKEKRVVEKLPPWRVDSKWQPTATHKQQRGVNRAAAYKKTSPPPVAVSTEPPWKRRKLT